MSKARKTHLRDYDPFGDTKYHKSTLGLLLSIGLAAFVSFYTLGKIQQESQTV